MNRRNFLAAFGSFALANRLLPGQTAPVRLSVDGAAGKPIPADFTGLSYEAAQLANPNFFSPSNKELISLFRELAPVGNLRIGGGTSEFTTYSDQPSTTAPPFEAFGPDTDKTTKPRTVTTDAALVALRGFLDAVNWSCLYGLNLGQGTVENAVQHARAVHRILGPRLLAFQIGNEPDSFRRRYRPATYGPADFLEEWTRFHDAIATAIENVKFAGPDISNKLPYLTAFAKEAPKHADVILLTSHYYAMGPAGNPQVTIDNLLDPDPKLTTLKARDLHIIEEAQDDAHLPYRMSEGNSCWNGGQVGVSDVFASALWAAGYLLQCAQRGWAGVNLHGGGYGNYSPLVGTPSKSFQRRPEFFGMKFAQRYSGWSMVPSTLAGASPRVDAFVLEKGTSRELVLINKTPDPVRCTLPVRMKASANRTLTGPALDARTGIEIHTVKSPFRGFASAAPYTASAFRLLD